LRMALHVPFIGLLSRTKFFPGLPAQPLCGREIWMARGGDILFGPLGYGNACDNEDGTKDSGENSGFDHVSDYRVRRGFPQPRLNSGTIHEI
jgi:hypothetical protein